MPKYSVLEDHFLEHAIGELGKDDQIIEILVRTFVWRPDFDEIGRALSFDEDVFTRKIRAGKYVCVRRRRFQGRIPPEQLSRRVVSQSGSEARGFLTAIETTIVP